MSNKEIKQSIIDTKDALITSVFVGLACLLIIGILLVKQHFDLHDLGFELRKQQMASESATNSTRYLADAKIYTLKKRIKTLERELNLHYIANPSAGYVIIKPKAENK